MLDRKIELTNSSKEKIVTVHVVHPAEFLPHTQAPSGLSEVISFVAPRKLSRNQPRGHIASIIRKTWEVYHFLGYKDYGDAVRVTIVGQKKAE